MPTKLSDKSGCPVEPSFRRRARNIVQVHAHASNGSWECYHVVRIGLGAIWGDHGRRRSLYFTTPHFCLKKGWVYPLLSISLIKNLTRVWPTTDSSNTREEGAMTSSLTLTMTLTMTLTLNDVTSRATWTCYVVCCTVLPLVFHGAVNGAVHTVHTKFKIFRVRHNTISLDLYTNGTRTLTKLKKKKLKSCCFFVL